MTKLRLELEHIYYGLYSDSFGCLGNSLSWEAPSTLKTVPSTLRTDDIIPFESDKYSLIVYRKDDFLCLGIRWFNRYGIPPDNLNTPQLVTEFVLLPRATLEKNGCLNRVGYITSKIFQEMVGDYAEKQRTEESKLEKIPYPVEKFKMEIELDDPYPPIKDTTFRMCKAFSTPDPVLLVSIMDIRTLNSTLIATLPYLHTFLIWNTNISTFEEHAFSNGRRLFHIIGGCEVPKNRVHDYIMIEERNIQTTNNYMKLLKKDNIINDFNNTWTRNFSQILSQRYSRWKIVALTNTCAEEYLHTGSFESTINKFVRMPKNSNEFKSAAIKLDLKLQNLQKPPPEGKRRASYAPYHPLILDKNEIMIILRCLDSMGR